MKKKSLVALGALVTAAVLTLTGCVAGERSATDAVANPGASGWSSDVLNIDFATYNPLSLLIKNKGWIESTVGAGVKVNWVQSLGSNKANEALRAGAIDVGSTAGSAALLARSNGSPIQAIDIFSQPNWAAILVSKDSTITSVAQLKGKTIAATLGTDPYFFLLQALEQAGLSVSDVTIHNLQHADGKAALESGAVDAWAGLDPLLSTSVATAGSKIIYDNVAFNSYGFLNATESFLSASPDLAQVVVNAYEKARAYAIANPDEVATILATVAAIDPTIATVQLHDRTNFAVSPVPGKAQHDVLAIIGPIFVTAGDVKSQADIDAALASLFNTTFIDKADPSAIG